MLPENVVSLNRRGASAIVPFDPEERLEAVDNLVRRDALLRGCLPGQVDRACRVARRTVVQDRRSAAAAIRAGKREALVMALRGGSSLGPRTAGGGPDNAA